MEHKSIKDKVRPYIPVAILSVFRRIRSCLGTIKRCYSNFYWAILRIRHKFQKRGFVAKGARGDVEKILCDNWVNCVTDLHPKDRRMNLIKLAGVQGMGTENTSFLINEIVRVFACNGTYLEVGTFHGYSLLSAALFNPSIRCIAIDNFSQFDLQCENENILKENLRKFKNPKTIEFLNGDYKTAIEQLFSKEKDLKINAYFYDGEHSFENQSEGLRIIWPHLSRKCVIFVDDINWGPAERASREFVAKHPEFKSVFKVKTQGNGSETWWNGFEVLVRE